MCGGRVGGRSRGQSKERAGEHGHCGAPSDGTSARARDGPTAEEATPRTRQGEEEARASDTSGAFGIARGDKTLTDGDAPRRRLLLPRPPPNTNVPHPPRLLNDARSRLAKSARRGPPRARSFAPGAGHLALEEQRRTEQGADVTMLNGRDCLRQERREGLRRPEIYRWATASITHVAEPTPARAAETGTENSRVPLLGLCQ
ncbi:unnamed protein product [Lampetra fluviatilis]